MQIPSILRGRLKNDPARARIEQFRALLSAALNVPFYRRQFDAAGLRALDFTSIEDIPRILNSFTPLAWDRYTSLFTGRKPGWRQQPQQRQTRSAIMLPYADARAGLTNCRMEPASYVDLYSSTAMAAATTDIYRLGRSIAAPAAFNWESDCAMVVFSGMDAGAFTLEQRNELWNKYQVPVFEQFLGTDGCVIASECEVHSGLHIRLDGVILETAGDEVVMTSLTDLESPAIRVRTGLKGPIEHDFCDCGRAEPRIQTTNAFVQPSKRAAAA